MTVRDLINTLLDFPMDMEVGFGIQMDENSDMDILGMNAVEILEIDTGEKEDEPVVVLFHEDSPDPSLN